MSNLEEHRKMEKRLQGLELKHIPRGEMWRQMKLPSAPLITWRSQLGSSRSASSSHRLLHHQQGQSLLPLCHHHQSRGAPDYGLPSGDRVLLALARLEGVDWILELKAFLISGKLPEEESEAERIVCQATGYCIKDGNSYRRCPSGVALKCISTHEGQELLKDIHVGECGHHSSAVTLTGKAYHNGFYWPSALSDAVEMVKRCEACQFHTKQIHQPAQELQTSPLTWPFAVWGLDILGPFPRAQGGYRYLYVAINKFTKWAEVEPVDTSPTYL
jgi:hypothetical protein